MIGGRGERVQEIRDEDLVEIGLPVHAQTFKEKKLAAKAAAQKESQGIVEAYAAVVELGNSEEGIVFDKEQARKNLIDLLNVKKEIEAKWRINEAWRGTHNQKYVRLGASAAGIDVTSDYGWGSGEQKRRKEILKNFEKIETIFGAYENLKTVFADFDKYIDGFCEDYSAELEAKARASAEQKQKALVLERGQKVESVVAEMKVSALAAKRLASGSVRSQLTVEEIQEIGLRAEKSVPKISVEKPEMSKEDRESLERVRVSNNYEYTVQELEEEVEGMGK